MEHRRADVTVAMNHGRSFGGPPTLHWSTARRCAGASLEHHVHASVSRLQWSTTEAAMEHRAGVAAAMEQEHRRAGVGIAMGHCCAAAVAAKRLAEPTGGVSAVVAFLQLEEDQMSDALTNQRLQGVGSNGWGPTDFPRKSAE